MGSRADLASVLVVVHRVSLAVGLAVLKVSAPEARRALARVAHKASQAVAHKVIQARAVQGLAPEDQVSVQVARVALVLGARSNSAKQVMTR